MEAKAIPGAADEPRSHVCREAQWTAIETSWSRPGQATGSTDASWSASATCGAASAWATRQAPSELAGGAQELRNGIALAGKQVAASKLEVTATFTDGSTATCIYRISLVDNYEQVLSDRFDALCSISDPVEKIRETGLPWYQWDREAVEAASASDARLTAPIYAITDITE